MKEREAHFLPYIFNQQKMPIISKDPVRRLSQEEFGAVAYDVMDATFAIHNEFGRFFDEKIYKRELLARIPEVTLEAQVDVVYDSFRKPYFADVMVGDGALFEFKAVDAIHKNHIGQTINYLQLFDLAHAKIVNVRPERVQSEFVNYMPRLCDHKDPAVVSDDFKENCHSSRAFRDILMTLIRDWGASLELRLYESALIHFLGGESKVCRKTQVIGSQGSPGYQEMKFLSANEVFWLTAFPASNPDFEKHALRLLNHTNISHIQWANISPEKVTFKTLAK